MITQMPVAKLQALAWAKDNATWIDRFQLMDALNGCVVRLDTGDAPVANDKICLPGLGPVSLFPSTYEELHYLLNRAVVADGGSC